MKRLNVFVSVVLVTDKNSLRVSRRVEETTRLLKKNYANYEVVVVDNGLIPSQLTSLSGMLGTTPCIRVIRLARTLETDTAIFAGMEASIGDYVCVAYNKDPVKLIPTFINENQKNDIVFGLATNMQRGNFVESLGAKVFYWYNRKYLNIDIPEGSTYFMSFNRTAVNALTRSGRYVRHIRHLAKQVGFSPSRLKYELPSSGRHYAPVSSRSLFAKGIDILSNYSSHPLRLVSYFGIFASLLNIMYAVYIVIVNLARNDVEKGWTTLSLQSSIMFLLLFLILAIIAEYVGKILVESRNEPPYHVMQELSSTISLADVTRRNVTR